MTQTPRGVVLAVLAAILLTASVGHAQRPRPATASSTQLLETIAAAEDAVSRAPACECRHQMDDAKQTMTCLGDEPVSGERALEICELWGGFVSTYERGVGFSCTCLKGECDRMYTLECGPMKLGADEIDLIEGLTLHTERDELSTAASSTRRTRSKHHGRRTRSGEHRHD